METITKKQLARLHTLLQKTGLTEVKRDLIHHFTDGRTVSSREMHISEYDELIEHLLANDPRQRMIRKVYALAYKLRIIYSGNEIDAKLNTVALDGWLKRNSYLHKPLSEYQMNELPKLVSQLEQVVKHNEKTASNKAASNSVNDLLNEIGISTATSQTNK